MLYLNDKNLTFNNIENIKVKNCLYNLWFHQKVLKFCCLSPEEEEEIRKGIVLDLEVLDSLKVPFHVQNTFLFLAQNGQSFDEYIFRIKKLEEAKCEYYKLISKSSKEEVLAKVYHLKLKGIATIDRFKQYLEVSKESNNLVA